MDSAGFPPAIFLNFHLLNFLSKQKPTEILYNNDQIQDFDSNLCGLFCLGFIYAKACQIGFYDFMSVFQTMNLKANDKIIQNILAILVCDEFFFQNK